MKFEDYQLIYRENLINSVLPFWQINSPDWDMGGTYSCLDRDGRVYDTKKYLWLVGRSVWMFLRLYNVLGKNQGHLKIAELGLDFIEKHAADSKGRYYFSLTREGSPYFYQRKVYSAVFIMLAYLEYFNTTGKEQYLSKSIDIFWDIKKWISDPSLLDRRTFTGLPKTSSLADVMVLAGVAIELAEVQKKQEYLDVMSEALANTKLHYNDHQNVFVETIATDGTELSDWPEGRLVNPGHSIEVAWFLLHLLNFVPDKQMEQMAYNVIKGSLELGWDNEFGGIFYFMDISAKPTLQLESSMKLWWPHTEAIYALSLAYKKTGDNVWLDWLAKVHDYAFSHFVDDEIGGWFGYCDRRGNLTHTCKGGNYKGFFHVPRALLFVSQL